MEIRIRSFGTLNKQQHETLMGDDNLASSVNLDLYQEGVISPRDGLSKVTSWPGLIHAGTTVRTGEASLSFGVQVLMLIPPDNTRTGPPAVEDSE